MPTITRPHAYDHTTTPDFCTRADAREILPHDSIFVYGEGFGAGSVAAFANLFRCVLLLRHGGWWIDTDMICLDAEWPDSDVVAGWQSAGMACNAVLRIPAGHGLAERAVAECVAAGRNVV
jgi:Glycosyltransferase sugar-binding region containing DXD motif